MLCELERRGSTLVLGVERCLVPVQGTLVNVMVAADILSTWGLQGECKGLMFCIFMVSPQVRGCPWSLRGEEERGFLFLVGDP